MFGSEPRVSRRWQRLVPVGGAAACLVAGVMVSAGTAFAAGSTLYVSPDGSHGAADVSCATAGYLTIGAAVSAAPVDATVVVCAGSYAESVTVTKTLHLVGRDATIAPGAGDGLQGVTIEGAGAAGASVSGFTITGARWEGVLVQQTSHVIVSNNTVSGNDVACQPQTGNDDCGEGLHVRAVTDSTVAHNVVKGNTGGIHLTDGVPAGSFGSVAFGYSSPSGPTYGNTITGNLVEDNLYDCGISLPSHNSDAVPNPLSRTDTQVQGPTAGGVYDNTITNNTVIGNGTEGGGGSGILMAAPFPGTASYDNLIAHNYVTGNGHAGITLHSHAPFQDLNDNRIVANIIGTNNAKGDGDSGDTDTTGVVVFSAVTPLSGTLIAGNRILNDTDGVYLNGAGNTKVAGNHYWNVTTPVVTVSSS